MGQGNSTETKTEETTANATAEQLPKHVKDFFEDMEVKEHMKKSGLDEAKMNELSKLHDDFLHEFLRFMTLSTPQYTTTDLRYLNEDEFLAIVKSQPEYPKFETQLKIWYRKNVAIEESEESKRNQLKAVEIGVEVFKGVIQAYLQLSQPKSPALDTLSSDELQRELKRRKLAEKKLAENADDAKKTFENEKIEITQISSLSDFFREMRNNRSDIEKRILSLPPYEALKKVCDVNNEHIDDEHTWVKTEDEYLAMNEKELNHEVMAGWIRYESVRNRFDGPNGFKICENNEEGHECQRSRIFKHIHEGLKSSQGDKSYVPPQKVREKKEKKEGDTDDDSDGDDFLQFLKGILDPYTRNTDKILAMSPQEALDHVVKTYQTDDGPPVEPEEHYLTLTDDELLGTLTSWIQYEKVREKAIPAIEKTPNKNARRLFNHIHYGLKNAKGSQVEETQKEETQKETH